MMLSRDTNCGPSLQISPQTTALRRRSGSVWWSSILAILLLTSSVGVRAEDPLDKVTGTEQWRRAPLQDPEAEWDEWLVARKSWREALRELQLQRKRSAQLARFLRFRAPKRVFSPARRPARRRSAASPRRIAPPTRHAEPARPAVPPRQGGKAEGSRARTPRGETRQSGNNESDALLQAANARAQARRDRAAAAKRAAQQRREARERRDRAAAAKRAADRRRKARSDRDRKPSSAPPEPTDAPDTSGVISIE
jgi:hypothetical protein